MGVFMRGTLGADDCRLMTAPASRGCHRDKALCARMKLRTGLIALSFALFAPDALAWGLQTHLFFAQYVLAALPFADPELRAVALRLPRVVLAGACLPDLGIVGQLLGTPAF